MIAPSAPPFTAQQCQIAISWQKWVGVLTSKTVVWKFNVDDVKHPHGTLVPFLQEADYQKAQKYRNPADASRFLTGRGGLRKVATAAYNARPVDLALAYTAYAKPYFTSQALRDVHFNIAHSGEMVLIATSTMPVGIDVEWVNHNINDLDALISYTCGPQEIKQIRAATDALAAFYTAWVCKEALLKAEGLGLIDALPELDVSQIYSTLPPIFTTSNYHVYPFQITPNYLGSIAVSNCEVLPSFMVIE